MKVIDGHCDVLYKMYNDASIAIDSADKLDATLPRMKQVNMLMQAFAIFLPEDLENPSFDDILDYIDIFHSKVLHSDEFMFIRTKEDLKTAVQHNKIGALLTLEGADALQGDVKYIRTLFDLGVRTIGLTWNYGNWAADGVLEPRQGGLSLKGIACVHTCNELGMILDVSHLSERAFWDLCVHTTRPFIASHSNALQICNHPRNLSNAQIETMIARKSLMGITFVPQFLNNNGTATISDVIRHVDHVCSLGGKDQLAFGSDFDGIDKWVNGLEHTGQYYALYNQLLQTFSQDDVDGLLWRNWFNFYNDHLPEGQSNLEWA